MRFGILGPDPESVRNLYLLELKAKFDSFRVINSNNLNLSPHLHGCPLDGCGDELVLDEAPDPPVRLADELHERALVVLPEAGQLTGRRVLAARQLQGHLEGK